MSRSGWLSPRSDAMAAASLVAWSNVDQASGQPAARLNWRKNARCVRPFPLANWVNGVDLGEVVGQSVEKAVTVKAAKMTLAGESVEDLAGVRLDVLRQAEQVGLGDGYRTDLARPRIEVTEDLTVKSAQMVEVVVARQHAHRQVGERGLGQAGLDLTQALRVRDAEVVTQNTAMRIDGRIVGHRTP